MQICTLTQTHNHASIPPLSFLQAGCPYSRPTNSIKALKAHNCRLSIWISIMAFLIQYDIILLLFCGFSLSAKRKRLKQTLKSQDHSSFKAPSENTTVGVSECKDEPSTIIIVSAYSLTSSAAFSMFHSTDARSSTNHVSTSHTMAGAHVNVSASQPLALKAKSWTSTVTRSSSSRLTNSQLRLVILAYFYCIFSFFCICFSPLNVEHRQFPLQQSIQR